MPLAGGPGKGVVRMLQYRNLDWTGMAKALALVTPTYLSAATYGVIGSGREELTPRLVTDFAALLGMDARDLAALTGVDLPELPPPPPTEAADAAALLWEARRLSAAQAQHVADVARSLRTDSQDTHVTEPPDPTPADSSGGPDPPRCPADRTRPCETGTSWTPISRGRRPENGQQRPRGHTPLTTVRHHCHRAPGWNPQAAPRPSQTPRGGRDGPDTA